MCRKDPTVCVLLTIHRLRIFQIEKSQLAVEPVVVKQKFVKFPSFGGSFEIVRRAVVTVSHSDRVNKSDRESDDSLVSRCNQEKRSLLAGRTHSWCTHAVRIPKCLAWRVVAFCVAPAVENSRTMPIVKNSAVAVPKYGVLCISPISRINHLFKNAYFYLITFNQGPSQGYCKISIST